MKKGELTLAGPQSVMAQEHDDDDWWHGDYDNDLDEVIVIADYPDEPEPPDTSYNPESHANEPTSNLDEQGINWYNQLIKDFTNNQLVIICSNQHQEYQFCQHQLLIRDYK